MHRYHSVLCLLALFSIIQTVECDYSVSVPSDVSAGGTLVVTWNAPSGHSSSDKIQLVYNNTEVGSISLVNSAVSGTVSFGASFTSVIGEYTCNYMLYSSGEIAASTVFYMGNSAYGLSVPSIVSPASTLTVSFQAPSGHSSNDYIELIYINKDNETELTGSVTLVQSGVAGSVYFSAALFPYLGYYYLEYHFYYSKELAYQTSFQATNYYYSVSTPDEISPGGTLAVEWEAPSGHSSNDYISIFYINSTTAGSILSHRESVTLENSATVGMVYFSASTVPFLGSYLIGYFSHYSDAIFVIHTFVTTEYYYSLTIPEHVSAGGSLPVSWEADPGHSSNDYLTMYFVHEDLSLELTYKITKVGSATSGTNTFPYTALPHLGNYIVQYNLYYSGEVVSSESFVATNYGYSLSVPLVVSAGASLVVEWEAAVGHSSNDKLVLFFANSSSTLSETSSSSLVDSGTSGSKSFSYTTLPYLGDYLLAYQLYSSAEYIYYIKFTATNDYYSLVLPSGEIYAGSSLMITWYAPSGHSSNDYLRMYSYDSQSYTATISLGSSSTSGSKTFSSSAIPDTGNYSCQYVLYGSNTVVQDVTFTAH